VKIVLYGDAAQRGNGGWCYAETLRELGHEVLCADDGVHFERYRRLELRALRKLLGGPLERDRRRHAAELVELARRERPEIVIVLKGLNIAAAEVQELRRGGAWVVNINHDDFFSFNRANRSRAQRGAISAYDFVFVTREVNVAEVRPHNPHVEFFPFAYYPRIHRPVPIPEAERERFGVDVVFVGTWERERGQLLERLVQEVPARYAIWGNLWERAGRRSPLRRFIRGRAVMMDEMAKALGGAQIALGFLRKKNRDDYTQRTFEIPACGGLLLAERTARQQSFYREGLEAEFFDPGRPDELVAKVSGLLADPARRAQLREAGHAALLRQHHTYRDRLERLLEVHARARRAAPGGFGN
jgi:glycosyltransferase involved in cell wall biosynthesis